VVIEDNIRYYSSILPVMYTEAHQPVPASNPGRYQRLLIAGATAGASKILLCSDYEDAERSKPGSIARICWR